jgi:hypothetical protein
MGVVITQLGSTVVMLLAWACRCAGTAWGFEALMPLWVALLGLGLALWAVGVALVVRQDRARRRR